VRAGMAEQQAEREFRPFFARNHHEQEVTTGFQDARGFVERLVSPLTVDMVHGIRTAQERFAGARLFQRRANGLEGEWSVSGSPPTHS